MTKITDEAVEAAATELLAHGEFSSNLDRNIPNAIIAARAALEAAAPHMSGVSVKPSAILSQIALWSDDEGLELSMGQGDDLVRRIMSAITSPAPEAAK